VRVLRAVDWLGRLEFRNMNTAPDLPVAMEAAMRGMPMRTGGGRVLVGFPAVRRALLQTPAGFFPGALLYVPGLAWLADRGYRWVALHRGREVCAAGSGGGA
jgi:predicted DCC family thiol-disulfide oxidoreductase YuxK